MTEETNETTRYERVLVVSAHPDDPEFGCGATVAKLAAEGADVAYVICTDGSQGGEDPSLPDEELAAIREREQREAGNVLGVKEIRFLGYKDGHLMADLDLRRAIVREIRRHRPELVLTHSPVRNLGVGIGASHPDHLAVGEATLQAVYPDSRNPRAFRDLLCEGFQPHRVKEVWLPTFDQGEHVVDVTGYVQSKIDAILCHQSQFNKPHQDPDGPRKWIDERMREVGKRFGVEYAEVFTRIKTA